MQNGDTKNLKIQHHHLMSLLKTNQHHKWICTKHENKTNKRSGKADYNYIFWISLDSWQPFGLVRIS